ncbi:vomeronasal type-2 receptor 26-like [Pyxicephalus adspersus]|uniref:vomeronasal type-2 receptor 26-like n=1 Tax=Pyxicephalus adspersus TaxID=30357 RepID=UPI003B5CB4D6
MERDNVAGFIGDLKSDTTLQMAQLLYLYGYTQISYGAGDSLLSDRKMYPNVFRTVPDNEMQYVAIVKLLKKLKWNWVGIITSDDEYGEREIQQLSKHLTDHGICIEFKILVSIINIMAWAIHDIYNYQKNKEPESVKSLHRLKNKVARYVKAIYNKGSNNKKTHFKEKGDWTSSLDIIPISRCNARCSPGYRKAPRGRIHACCYDCIPCSEGEVSNLTDSEHCFRCPEDEWPDKKKVECIPKIYEFLSYENDTMASVFSFISLIFSAVTLFVLVKFISNRNTPIVRANNRTVSFILLTSILLSFLSVFLFLGRPVDITCKLRQISFGIFFSIAVASVLAKTTTVCIAFKATKPDSSWKKWVTVKIFNSLVLTCSSVQVLICVIWLSVSPPYQEYDMHSSPGKIIIQCNEGSVIGFYSVLGYIGFLAAVSFVLAFMVRTLPDSFNEAKYITFSMLVFCSVWIVWIPVYLSAKGKYMVTVEIFAILASSAGLLGCIFFPKCYIIILKPEMNTRKKTLHIK